MTSRQPQTGEDEPLNDEGLSDFVDGTDLTVAMNVGRVGCPTPPRQSGQYGQQSPNPNLNHERSPKPPANIVIEFKTISPLQEVKGCLRSLPMPPMRAQCGKKVAWYSSVWKYSRDLTPQTPHKMTLYLSRAFVEFGPFPSAEMINFYQRGLLKDTDYVRADGTSEWLHVNDWAANPKATKAAAAVAPKKKTAVKKTKPAPAPAPAPAAKKAATKKAK